MHSRRRISDGRSRHLQAARFPGRIGRRPRPDSPSQDWSGVRRNAPVKGIRVCGRSADRGPLAQATVKRPADRGSLSSGRGQETCRSRIYHSDRGQETCRSKETFPRAVVKRPANRGSFSPGRGKGTCRSRIFHSDQSEKTCRSRIFPSGRGEETCRSRISHSDQSEKTCRSRIFPSGRGEETCRSRNFPTSRIPQQTFFLVLDRASTVTTVDSDNSDRGKHRGSFKCTQGGRF